MSINDIIKVSITKDKSFNELEINEVIPDESYTISYLPSYPVIIIFDLHSSIKYNIFICDVIRELRKTLLNDKIWCSKDSSIFHNYKSHFNTLKYIYESNCVLLFLLDYLSLKRSEFLDMLRTLKIKIETTNHNFILISVINCDFKTYVVNHSNGLDDDIYNFLISEVLNNGFYIDLSVDNGESCLYTVANVLPKIVTHLYPPHQLALIDLQQFYHGGEDDDLDNKSGIKKAMYLWDCSELVDWFHSKGYPNKVLEDIEINRINGWIIQNVTSEELSQFLTSASAMIKHKLIEDVYQFLNENDIESKNWQIRYRKVKVHSKEIYIISDFNDGNNVERFVTSIKSLYKSQIVFNGLYGKTKDTNSKLKHVASSIARSKIIITFITKYSFVNGFSSFKRFIEKKILFSLWIKRPIIFILWDMDCRLKDPVIKIMLDNQPVVDFRGNTLDQNCKLLLQIMGMVEQQLSNKPSFSNEKFSLEKYQIPTFANFENSENKTNLSPLDNQIRKKLVLHYHSESRKKVDVIQKVLEKNEYIVDLIAVDNKSLHNIAFEADRNKKEEILINADAVLTCLSPNYIKSANTKGDLRFICQILHKKMVIILVQHIKDMKLWYQIQKSLHWVCKFNLNKQTKPLYSPPTVDLVDLDGFQSISSSALTREIKNLL